MFYRLRRWLDTNRHGWARAVLSTAPLRLDPDGPVIVSQIGGVFTNLYLIAVKSLGGHIAPSRVIVVDDGSLSPRDRDTIARHVPRVEFRLVSEIDVGRCPRGGCWERLATCIDASADRYVIQADSDTVTVGRPDALLDAVTRNLSVTLTGHGAGADAGSAVRRLSLAEAADARRAEFRDVASSHIQIVSETMMRDVDALSGTTYFRGCAGFAGYARGAIAWSDVERYSLAMEAAIGPRWHEWGTEQVTSNYVIANAAGGSVLPWPAYINMSRGLDEAAARVIHFSGELRFADGVYERAARTAMQAMRRKG
ncbi:MAG: hypothetical protein MUF21_12965 [Gemmatimonadaceae bacterium]|jgi:hypothetical protein|nr:hypothetical protein [Gemmatimonadaceae bacterium]